MKKLLALLLTFVMVLSFAACGTSGESSGDDNSAPDSGQTQQGGTQQTGELTQTEKEKLVSQVINLSAFGKDSDGEPYKWTVIDVDTENKKALLLMDGYIDTAYMFTDDEVHTWENCQIREWLNFQPNMDVMFTAREQNFILLTEVKNPANPETGVSSGKDTKDKLFLLSVQEMEKYFENPQDRVVYDIEGNPVAQYLRTSGGQENYFAITKPDDSGEIDYYGSYGYTEALAIRPAMWVDISGGVQAETPAVTPEPQKPQPTEKPADEKENTSQASASDFIGTKTGKFYSVFTGGAIKMDYELVIDGQVTRMVTATKGDKAYMENYLNGEVTGCSVIDGKDMYIIEHSSKLIIKMALENDLLTVASKVVTENDVDMTQLEKGSRTIDGEKYDTESWVMEGDKVTMCFDGNKLAYIITEPGDGETIIKILGYSSDIDDSLFTIPSGYTVLDMSGN